MSVRQMCTAASVSRAGFYRHGEPVEATSDDIKLRDEIPRIALLWPAYGRRRITAELHRRGWDVNHKRVHRIMREDNLLCLRKRKFMVTTNSAHDRRIYSNLAAEMTLPGINQLWRADITYIRLETEFIYLAVVLDAYSRRVVGWALDRSIEDDLPLAALRMALEQRSPQPGLVHHSDRGSVYASKDYTGLLQQNDIQVSMSRRGNPYDNAACESFMKTLKHEEVYRQEYRGLQEARSSIQRFLEQVYNETRLHSALQYQPPAEFERNLAVTDAIAA